MKLFFDKLFADMKVRFLFVGALNTAVGYGLYALFIYFKMHYSAALFISTAIAVLHSYLWNKYFTFKSGSKSPAEPVKFALVYAAGYFLNLLILFICIEKLLINSYAAGIISMFFTTVISYFGHKHISFKGV
ncbi:MAG TPA: GtrA family protein [Candidatus Goldiibacteriota bacterium]|nr:GtrA family protein [Candidatus Goldiibacteriota bacterium]HRQ44153.1 GtrA family protein [Candidatus Goldiibacteriota bacterium]